MKKLIGLSVVLALLLCACSERNTPRYPTTNGEDRNNMTDTITTVIAPVARFTYKIEQPVAVIFTNTSTNNPTKYQWNFGDGTTSTQQSPKHRYSKAGSYIVTLTATNSAGSHSSRATITIVEPKVYITGINYLKVGREGMYYRTVCRDDDFFTTTWFKTTYTPILYNNSLPYSFDFSSPQLMDGLADDDYYTFYVYWNKTTNGDGTQILKQNILTSQIYTYPTEITLTNSPNDTQISVMFMYK